MRGCLAIHLQTLTSTMPALARSAGIQCNFAGKPMGVDNLPTNGDNLIFHDSADFKIRLLKEARLVRPFYRRSFNYQSTQFSLTLDPSIL